MGREAQLGQRLGQLGHAHTQPAGHGIRLIRPLEAQDHELEVFGGEAPKWRCGGRSHQTGECIRHVAHRQVTCRLSSRLVRVAGAAITLLIGFGLSRVLGALREIVLTSQFGATTEYDLYVAAFRIPDVVFTLVAGGALGSTLVPVLAERRERHGAGSDARLAATVFNAIALVSALAAVVLAALTPWLAPFVGAGFDPPEQARLALLMRILLVQPILLGVSEVLTRYLNVHGHFLTPALAPALYNVPIMVAALVFGRQLGSVGLTLGVLAGALLYLLVQIPAALAAGFRFRLALELRD
ncbi:MAG TPA: lipid II flippase MurJ, partial [Chloroflexota bacterium]|nr:lipid II flippase MurJ [Chloroflexota bacterium]